jgi:hypothetical protein
VGLGDPTGDGEAHGGSLKLARSDRDGTTFVASLPATSRN